MPKKSVAKALDEMPEAFVSDATITRAVSHRVKAGKLRKLASRLYTRNLTDPPEAIVKRNLWQIVAAYFPGALIADRTAFENAPAGDGSICVVSEAGRNIRLPGHTLRPRRGLAPLPSDRPFIADLFLSSAARAYIENMRPSRTRDGLVARTLSRREIEERLDTLIRRSGEKAANRLREEIQDVGKALNREEEAADLDALIGSLLGTRDSELSAPAAIARQRGRPYDADRIVLFQSLHAALRSHLPPARTARNRGPEGNAALAFYDAYFSNFIEGTKFSVEEATDIVFRGVIPDERPRDAHDVLGTWHIVSNLQEMARTPQDSEAFFDLIRTRHATMMEGRPDIRPGEFKKIGNRAGATVFVKPDLVVGTLEQGFALIHSLDTPLQRAVFIKFLTSEVHPFVDGNGRVARIMMNAELVAGGEERIVIPIVFRDTYLSALRALSRSRLPVPLLRALDYAQRWTAAVDWRSVETTRSELEDCNAFISPADATKKGRDLQIPTG